MVDGPLENPPVFAAMVNMVDSSTNSFDPARACKRCLLEKVHQVHHRVDFVLNNDW